MIDTKTQLQMIGVTGGNPVTVITGLRYSTNTLKLFNNMTFMYDPNWSYDSTNPTYPLAFFHVKSMTESMTSEISNKPMLFYNSQASMNDGTKAGGLNIVSDNIVIKPKTYKLELIIPANGSTLSRWAYDASDFNNVMSFLIDHENTNAGLADYNFTTFIDVFGSVVNTLLNGLYGLSISASAICNMILEQQDYNKASLEYMWRNRRIYKLKLWNGWQFKYVAMQDLEITKKGEDGKYYEATMTCTEVPILTFRNQEQTTTKDLLSTVSEALGKAQKTVADTFITAMTTTAGGN